MLNDFAAGIRMLDGNVSDRIEAESLNFNNEVIDIYTCSWGPPDDGKTVEKPGTLAAMALENGVKEVNAGVK